jgi:hypothetical protein
MAHAAPLLTVMWLSTVWLSNVAKRGPEQRADASVQQAMSASQIKAIVRIAVPPFPGLNSYFKN